MSGQLKKNKIYAMFAAVMLLFCSFGNTVFAAGYKSLSVGTYEVNASLNCYVNAMGGIEFGNPLLKSASITVDNDGNCMMTLYFTKSKVTIYSVTCDTFVDVNPSYVTEDRGVKNGTIGYYDQNGNLKTEKVSYKLSDDTALNAASEAVHYVESITFPVTHESDKYYLTLYINSNVMGVQFCNNNDKATMTTYPAVLSVSWDKISRSGNTPTSNSAGQNTAAQSPENTEKNISENNNSTIVEEDGLNIHYADENKTSAAPVSYTAYLNTNGLIIIGVCACFFVSAGIILLISAKKRKADKI